MASLTEHFQLQELNANDPFSTNGQKYTTTDRATIDRLLYQGAVAHHHNGDTVTQADPASSGTLNVSTSGGTLPASTRVTYQFTWVDPNGFETGPSPAVYVDLPAQITTPNPPSAVPSPGTGTLPPGAYFYEVSAYTNNSTNETSASTPTYATLTATGEIVLTMPSLPSGATGFNIYRLDPNGANYLFLNSTTGTTYTDDGSVAVNCNRLAPSVNNTAATNSITFNLPATPPAGYTWNLYRTLVIGSWTNSFLTNQPNDAISYVDTGLGTTTGSPPLSSELIPSPSKVLLTGGAEVQGALPPSMVDQTTPYFPHSETFAFAGTLSATTGKAVWTCPYPRATIQSVQCSLGRGSTPSAQPVIADVQLGTGVNPTYSSIFQTAAKPQVPVGQQIGAPAPCDSGLAAIVAGDSLSVDIDQAGGGATPTDHDLTVTIYMLVATD